jgi:hypothetical protein
MYASYYENPSRIEEGDLNLLTRIKKGDVEEWVNSDGEVVKVQKLASEDTYMNDRREYRKVYVKELSTIKELSSAGLKVWCYVLYNLPIKVDEIFIDTKDCMIFCGYKSKVNVYDGIANLLMHNLLFRKTGSGSYFININAFFNGKRKF